MRLTRWLVAVAFSAPTCLSAQSTPDTTMKATVAAPPATALQAFEARKAKGGGGRFIDEQELRKKDDRPLVDVVMRLPGLNKHTVRGETWIASSRTLGKVTDTRMGGRPSQARCYVSVYEDGVALFRGQPDPPPDFGRLYARDYGGVEFYPNYASIPTDLGQVRQSECGVLLLWKRAR